MNIVRILVSIISPDKLDNQQQFTLFIKNCTFHIASMKTSDLLPSFCYILHREKNNEIIDQLKASIKWLKRL